MDKPMTFEEWWIRNKEIFFTAKNSAQTAFNARDAEILALRTRLQAAEVILGDVREQMAKYPHETMKQLFESMKAYDSLTSTPSKEEKE